jgi:small-conductance mechanosensitive channel
MLSELIDTYPELTAVVVLALGFVLGRLAETMVRHVLVLADRLVARYGTRQQALFSPLFQRASGLFTYGTVLVLAAILAVRLLDIEQLTYLLDSLLAFAPRFVVALFIVGIGNVLGALLRNVAAGMLTDGNANALGPRLVHATVLGVAFITALQQLGLDISFITQLALVLLASLLGGLSLAFALGARQYVANLMAQPELARYATGDRLRIDEDEGVIVEIHRTGLTLATDEGLVAIPSSRLAGGRVVRISSEPVSG